MIGGLLGANGRACVAVACGCILAHFVGAAAQSPTMSTRSNVTLSEPARPMAAEPLPSWNDGPAKSAIIDFITRVTQVGGPDFVPAQDRIAVFDNDGTLWTEQPLYVQFVFALDRVKTLAPQHPEWQSEEPFRSVLAGDIKGALASGEKGLVKLMMATHAGMTTDEFARIVTDWLADRKSVV